MWINIEFTNIIWLSGVPKISFRGGGVGFQLICEKWVYMYLHSAICAMQSVAKPLVC